MVARTASWRGAAVAAVDLVRAFSGDHGARRREQDAEVLPHGVILGVAQVEAHHVVERGTAASGHLPQAGDAGLGVKNAATMPHLVTRYLVGQRRSWADERHLTAQDVPELREFVDARSAQE